MSKWKVGKPLFMVTTDDTTGKVEIGEYVIRTIRGGKVSAIYKLDGITWGKRSTKAGDYGWLKTIPKWCRETWSEVGEGRTYLFTTKLAAIRAEMKSLDIDHFESEEAYNKAMKTLKGLETRNKAKKGKPDGNGKPT